MPAHTSTAYHGSSDTKKDSDSPTKTSSHNTRHGGESQQEDDRGSHAKDQGRFLNEQDNDKSGTHHGGKSGGHGRTGKGESNEDGREHDAQDRSRDDKSGAHGGKSGGHGRAGKGESNEDGREHNAQDRPRDEHGRFVSEDDKSGDHHGGKSGGHTGQGHEHDTKSSGHGQSGHHKGSGHTEGQEGADDARHKLAEAAREFALERPRDEHGRFLSDEEIGKEKESK